MTLKDKYSFVRPLTLLILLVVVFAGGYRFGLLVQEKKFHHAQIRQDGYRFIHPLVECEVTHPGADQHPDLPLFKKEAQQIIDEHLTDRSATNVALYFRDLQNGPSFGINEHEKFTPSSLMKVPLVMGVLKRAEHDSGLLRKKIMFNGADDSVTYQGLKPAEVLRPGQWYTVDDLIFRTLVFSDNNAAMLLADEEGMRMVATLLKELNIPVEKGRIEDYITVRNYSAFFRVLFNATYLDDHMSEHALGYLARSAFEDGFRAGVPKGTVVASKFGEFSSGVNQLHEFGIIYYPEHPFLLGVVTKGGSYESLSHVIQEISRAIYAEFDRQHRVVRQGPS